MSPSRNIFSVYTRYLKGLKIFRICRVEAGPLRSSIIIGLSILKLVAVVKLNGMAACSNISQVLSLICYIVAIDCKEVPGQICVMYF